jgi:hypothetical protein
LGEHCLCKAGVEGSSPFVSTEGQVSGIRGQEAERAAADYADERGFDL